MANENERLVKAVHDVLSSYIVDGPYPPMTIQQRQRLHAEWPPLAAALDDLVEVGNDIGLNLTDKTHRISH